MYLAKGGMDAVASEFTVAIVVKIAVRTHSLGHTYSRKFGDRVCQAVRGGPD